MPVRYDRSTLALAILVANANSHLMCVSRETAVGPCSQWMVYKLVLLQLGWVVHVP